jgi:tetratricopeptide (TPR) repeat protein
MKLALILAIALGAVASATPQAEIAANDNQAGITLMTSSDFKAAAAKFRDAAARDPNPRYFFNLCTALYQQGSFLDARTACDAVAANNPTPDLQQKTDKLIEKIKDGVKTLAPAELANQQGTQSMLDGKYEQAAEQFRRAADADPQPSYYFNLCTALYQQGIFGGALMACDQVAKLAPPAELQTKTNKLAEKIKSDAKAQHIDVQPVNKDPAEKLNEEGKNLMYSGDYRAAGEKFRDATKKDPQAKYFFNLCSALYQQGMFGAAMSACNEVAKHKPASELQQKASATIENIESEAKTQSINLAASTDPAETANREGQELLFNGKFGDAAKKFLEAATKDPQPRFFFNLCTAYYDLARLRDGLEACEAVSKHEPTAEMRKKVDGMIARIRSDAKAKKLTIE